MLYITPFNYKTALSLRHTTFIAMLIKIFFICCIYNLTSMDNGIMVLTLHFHL